MADSKLVLAAVFQALDGVALLSTDHRHHLLLSSLSLDSFRMTLCQEVIHTGWVDGLKSVQSRRHGAAYDTDIECWEARRHVMSRSWLCCLLNVRSRQLPICSEPVSPSVNTRHNTICRTEGGWNKNVSSPVSLASPSSKQCSLAPNCPHSAHQRLASFNLLNSKGHRYPLLPC